MDSNDVKLKAWVPSLYKKNSKNSVGPLIYHTAAYCTKLNGLLIYGGTNEEEENSGELIVISLNGKLVKKLKLLGRPPPPLSQHACCMWANKLIIFGGISPSSISNDMYIFNSETKNWSCPRNGGDTPSKRYGHSLTLLSQEENVKNLVLFGGVTDNNDNNMYIMKLYGKSWVDLVWKKYEQSVIPPLSQHASCSKENIMFIHGGRNLETNRVEDVLYSYNILNGEIKKIETNSKSPKARYGHTLECLYDKNVLILFGGITEKGKSLNDMWIFKLDENRWVKAYAYGDSPAPRYGHTFTLTVGTRAIVTGGSESEPMDFYLLNVGNIYYEGYTPVKDDKASFMDYSSDFFNLDIDSTALEIVSSKSKRKLIKHKSLDIEKAEKGEDNEKADETVEEIKDNLEDAVTRKNSISKKKIKKTTSKRNKSQQTEKVKTKRKHSIKKFNTLKIENESNEEKNKEEENKETNKVHDQKADKQLEVTDENEEENKMKATNDSDVTGEKEKTKEMTNNKTTEDSVIKIFDKRPFETNRRRSQRVYTSIKPISDESLMKEILSPSYCLSPDLVDTMDVETLKSEMKAMINILNHYQKELFHLNENHDIEIDIYRNKVKELKEYHVMNVLKLKTLPQPQAKRSSTVTNIKKNDSLRRSLEISSSAEKEILKMKDKNQSLPEGCEDNETNRKERIQSVLELLESERNYVRDLKILISEFMEPLELKGILPEKDIQTIFSNIRVIHSLNQEFLDSLEQMKDLPSEQQTVGGVFLTMADYLKMYTVYCSSQEISVPRVQELLRTDGMFERFIQSKFMSPVCRGLDIFSFLIQPIQRICKYPLLLRQIFKCTPSSHHDFEKLYFAIAKVEDVVMKINEGKRLIEAQMKMIEIEQTFSWEKKLPSGFEFIDPTRRLIKQGELSSYSNNSYTQNHLILFNDIILIAKVTGTKKVVKKIVPLLGIKVFINDEKEKHKGRSFTISHRKVKFNFVTSNEGERDQWIADINERVSEVKADSSKYVNIYEALTGENYSE